MTTDDYNRMLINMLARSKSWRVWYEPRNNNPDSQFGATYPHGNNIHAVKDHSHLVINITGDIIEIRSELDYKYKKTVELSDPEAFNDFLASFDIDENAPPRKFDPIDVMAELI